MGGNLEGERHGVLVTLSQAEIRDAPYKPSVPHLAKCRVLAGHCRHHRNMSPSKSGKAKDRPLLLESGTPLETASF